MKASGLISDALFAISMHTVDDDTPKSWLDFGIINESGYEGDLIYYVDALDHKWWTNEITGIKFGSGNDLDNAYSTDSYKASIDTTSWYTYVPQAYYSFIVNSLLENATSYAYTSKWGYFLPCSDEDHLNSLKVLFGEYWLELLPSDFLVPIPESESDGISAGQCSLGFFNSAVEVSGDTYWMLG